MDISAVLPVSMGAAESSTSSLNEEFSATTPNGDKVFTKPLGDKTVFQTPDGGQVTAAFIFDPDEEFTHNDTIASISTDYMTDLREAFAKYALEPSLIAPKTKTLQETIWDQLTSMLPKETLSKSVFSKEEQLNEFMDLVKASTTANYNEEQALTTFMKTQPFSFSFRIAVDSYPDENNKSGASSSKKKNKDKCGVLTFHLEGVLKKDVDKAMEEKESEKREKAKGVVGGSGNEKEGKGKEKGEKDVVMKDEKKENSNVEDKTKSKKRKTTATSLDSDDSATTTTSSSSSSTTSASGTQASKKGKKEKEKEIPAREKVLRELNLQDAFSHAEIVRIKEFPQTANLFFEAFGRYFSSCISSKHTKLEKKRNQNPLYH